MQRRVVLAGGLGALLGARRAGAADTPVPGALPDPLTFSGGGKVTTAREWREKRRPELLELFRTQVYGRAPVGKPESLRWEVKSVTRDVMEGTAARKLVAISWEGPGGKGGLDLTLFVPQKRERPAPTFLLICNRPVENIDPTREKRSPFWPAEEMVARGYAAAAFQVGQVAPDTKESWQHGVFQAFDRGRKPDSWGTIAAWAWGASRVMDYLESDKELDARRVAVVGHSRGGKTALWCGAEDPRFAMVVSNDSGCTGAAITRGKRGERIADINRGFPYWFNENYKRFNGKEEELPVDQHELLALIAPRLLYVASASEDTWADPAAEFRACVEAGPVYRLLGKKGVSGEQLPPPETPLHGGDIGYHLRTGKHDLTAYDWGRYMDFADQRLRVG